MKMLKFSVIFATLKLMCNGKKAALKIEQRNHSDTALFRGEIKILL